MLNKCLLVLGFEQCLADLCVFRLIRGGIVVLILVVYVDDIFAVGKKERCDQFGEDLNRMVPVKNLRELKWYSGCFYERDRESLWFETGIQAVVCVTEEVSFGFGVCAVLGRFLCFSFG